MRFRWLEWKCNDLVSSKRIGEYAVLAVERLYLGRSHELHQVPKCKTPLNDESAEPSGVQPSGGAM
jgi:hypothetical protein